MRLKHHPRTAELFSLLLTIAGLFALQFSAVRAASMFMRAHRNSRKLSRHIFLEKMLQKYQLYNKTIIDRLIPTYDPKIHSVADDWIITIKEPSEDEKGVLIVKFHDWFIRMHAEFDLDKLMNDYYLVLEPSHAGNCLPEILQFINYPKHPVIVMSPEPLDYQYLVRLKSNLIPIALGAADWNDDRLFFDMNLEKEYDCIMVGTWNSVKRHHVLFRALREMADPTFRLALVGHDWDITTPQLQDMIKWYDIENNVSIF
ncbi:MAG: hypothetical protein V3T31_00500, partial [candidate division Zixibacteria bacterium]